MTTPLPAAVITPIGKRTRLSDHIVETLSRLIVEGNLEPGSVIRTEDLGRQLGVSRTPMREALQRLEADGFVTVAPNGMSSVVRASTWSTGGAVGWEFGLRGPGVAPDAGMTVTPGGVG